MYMSVTMETPTKKQQSAKIKSIVECYLKQVAKAPVAEVDGYDTVQ